MAGDLDVEIAVDAILRSSRGRNSSEAPSSGPLKVEMVIATLPQPNAKRRKKQHIPSVDQLRESLFAFCAVTGMNEMSVGGGV